MKIRSLNDAVTLAKTLWDNKDEVKDIFNKAGSKASKHKTEMKTGLFADVQTLREMIGAYVNGTYNCSKKTVVYVIAGLLYFISPIDLVPDFLLGLGFVDDAAVLGMVVKRLKLEIEQFKNHKFRDNPPTIIIKD